MLKKLYIENIAIIKNLSLNLDSNFVVFTGETGSGKSIILEAINLIMGARGSKSLIRSGEKSCFISAFFNNISKEVSEKLKSLNYKLDKDELLISREFFNNSKNICKINGKLCNVSVLKEISAFLINIHGQNDNNTLLNNDMQRYFIDSYGNYHDLLEEYNTIFKNYQQLKKQWDNINKNESLKKQQLEFLKFQMNEIKSANLKPNEEQELLEKKQYIKNYNFIISNLSEAMTILDGSPDFSGVRNLMQRLEKILSKCSNINKINNIVTIIRDINYNIDDISYEINYLVDEMKFNELDINDIEKRLDSIYKLKKYGDTYENIMNFYQKISSEYENIIFSDNLKKSLETQIKQIYDKLIILAKQISLKRKHTAKDFTFKVTKYLNYLNLENVKFYIKFQTIDLGYYGNDRLDFFITTNLGQDLKPLTKVASGGEISRVMLAIKSVLASHNFINTIIFDEIDVGVSGNIAYKIGNTLKMLSEDKQIISITHSAQIAAMGNQHIKISKITNHNQTFTKIQELDYNKRKQEVARILGGASITDITLKNAEELLNFKTHNTI